MSEVLLIYPPYPWPSKSQPLGIAYIAAMLTKREINVGILDLAVSTMSNAELKKEIKKLSPTVIGISFMTPQYDEVCSILSLVKEVDMNIITVAGGAHVSAVGEKMFEIEELDYIVIGEGEETMSELCSFILKRNSIDSLQNISGIGYRDRGSIKITPKRDLIDDLDKIPFPAWQLLDMDKYSVTNLGGKAHEPVFPLLSSRGCPNQCIFCSSHVVFERRFRERSVENITEEISFLRSTYGARQFDFVDDTVTVNKNRMEELCDYFLAQDEPLLWMCNSRVNTVTPQLLKKMYKAGCRRIDFGVESGNEDILLSIKKNITLDQVHNAHHWAKEAGLIVSSFFMVGNLGESMEHIRRTAKFIEGLETDYVGVTIATPFPGTELYEMANEKEWIIERDWSRYNTSMFINKDWRVVSTNGCMNKKEIIDAYLFINKRIIRKKLKTMYGNVYWLKPIFYYEQIVKRIRRAGFLQTLRLLLRMVF